jgi:hypothetical protein
LAPKGAKNTSTLWREAQVLVGDGGLAVDVADPLEVIQQVMRYFYAMGVQGVGAMLVVTATLMLTFGFDGPHRIVHREIERRR